MEVSRRVKKIKEVTLTGSFVNILLTAGKITAGIAGKSSAMIADGVHSLSDLLTDIIVIGFVGVSEKERDSDHRYGHGKYETFATMMVSFILFLVGTGIFWSGARKVIDSINGVSIEQPGLIALYAALVSIVSKEALFWYTKIAGRNINSQTLVANAWHHRSDAFTSLGTALGISGAIFLGEKWRILDPIAGIIVSLFILKIAWKIANPSVRELLESSLPAETENDISGIISNTPGVECFHNLRTRKIGEAIAIDVHVKVDKELSVESSHHIASEIENSLREKFGSQSHIGIHIEPFYGNPET
ncbi:MAG: cation diffusion facilitator family transporter [Bacteroidales bacterium]|nr:cation diffusion facilitator family transporter [Bacteroidales bacterium]